MIDRDIKKFILRALLRQNADLMSSTEIKLAIRNAFSVALTDGDLDQYITELQELDFIAGTRDPISGILWALTPLGKISAQRLVKT